MAYATQADMITRYGEPLLVQLTDIGNPMTGALVPAVLQAKLDDAAALIDGYLVGRYTLPLEVAPAILKVHACVLAMYMLLGGKVSEEAAVEYKAALDYLKQVARGDITLLPPQVATPPAGVGPVLFSPGSKVMGRDNY
jgi:phage gp36-like protein